jgi:hypothetical protein
LLTLPAISLSKYTQFKSLAGTIVDEAVRCAAEVRAVHNKHVPFLF